LHNLGFWQPILIFGLIGALALVLRWTFSDRNKDAGWRADGDPPAGTGGEVLAGVGEAAEPADAGAAESSQLEIFRPLPVAPPPASAGEPDDYGLLRVVVEADSGDAARHIVKLLAIAGIRATTSTDPDTDRSKVLVFDNDLNEARRVVGWPT
jgi:hypothetical protein